MTKETKRKIRKIKRAIRKEIAIEINALKELAPIFGGAVVMLGGLWAWVVLAIGFFG